MNKGLILHIILLLSSSIAAAQEPGAMLLKLGKTGRDTNRVNLLLQLGRHYVSKSGSDKKDLDSAFYYVQSGETLSSSIHAIDHQYRAVAMNAEISIKRQDFDSADKLFTTVTDHYHSTGEQLKEAAMWDKYADLIQYDDAPHLNIRSKCVNKSYEIYKSRNDKLKASQALGRVADVDLNMGNYDRAEQELLSVIAQSKALHYPKTYYAYYLLAETYYRKNDVQKTLMARIECVNSYENYPLHTIDDGMLYYYDLARAYFKNKLYEKAIPFYQKSMEISVKLADRGYYFLCIKGIVTCYTDLKRYREGLASLRKLSKRYPARTVREESITLSTELKLYNLLNNVYDAEKIILDYKRVFKKLYQDSKKDAQFYTLDNYVENYEPLLKHYILTKQWDKLSEELKSLEALPTKKMLVVTRLTIYTDRFKLDSARGNFLAALKGFQRIKLIQDSLTDLTNSKQINELEAKYESVKKDKTIQNLNGQSSIQKSELEKSNLQRNITLAGILITIILAALFYFAYRNKRQINFRLQSKQDQINRQNNELSALVREEEKLLKEKDALLKQQEGLIGEKEWLLREVHHRVKNNLQIVMSLLYTQAAYLQNTDAIDAIRDSQNRVQAISIIHQKLYSKGNVATVVMSDYVGDLVRHLYACYNCYNLKIRFKEIVEPVNLDISQAVPMGLILNEAITNSIKYAFGKEGGEIMIEGHLIDPETISLVIADNGKGLPADFDLAATSSLGMEMMRALSKQLGGSFAIKNDPGVVIAIKFKIENTFKPVAEKLSAL